jgi:hypothetical protein
MRTIHPPLRKTWHIVASLAMLFFFVLTFTLVTGCGAPPSVVPLLTVAATATEREASLVEEESLNDEQAAEAAKQRLTSALQADLQQRPNADLAWILSAAKGYAAAREAVAKSLAQQRALRQLRAQNLRDAAAAQRRAISLIQLQDELFNRATGVDLWQLDRLTQSTSATTSPTSRASTVTPSEESR